MIMHTMRCAGTPALTDLLSALAALLCGLTVLVWTPLAWAHASLIESTPTDGAMLPSAPMQARLVFNEPVSPLVLKIIQPDGAAIDLQHIQTLPDGLQLSLPALPQQGAYALSWRVVSADGHPVSGALTFSVGAANSGSANPAQAVATHPDRNFLIWLSRLGWYIGLFFGIGMACCHALNSASNTRRSLGLWTLSLGGAAALLSVGLLGVDALDMPLSGLFNIDAWRTASTTSFGLSAALALAAFGCATLVWCVASTSLKRLLAALALVILGTALAASGHASAAPPSWLARPAVWLHGVAVTLWIGSLIPLYFALSDTPDLAPLRRFSRLIPGVLLVLFVSGGVLIYLQFDRPASLWLTAYGQVLSAKLLLLVLLLGLGTYNRYRLTNAVLHENAGSRHAMRHIIYVECVLAIAILAVAALWRFTPPPRAMHAAPTPTQMVSAHVHTNTAIAKLTLSPATQGRAAELTVQLLNADLTPLIADEVDVAFSNPTVGIEPIAFPAQHISDGTWQISNIELPRQASWHIRIDALISDFERISLETTLKLSD